MYIRVIILVIVIVLHLITPNWFITDYIALIDKLMILFLVVSQIIYYFNSDDKWQRPLSLLLTINVLIYFVLTTQNLAADLESATICSRLLLILKSSNEKIPQNIGEILEGFNVIQFVLSFFVTITIIIKFYLSKNKRNKKNV